jgi:hypothetical protein
VAQGQMFDEKKVEVENIARLSLYNLIAERRQLSKSLYNDALS